MSSILQLETGLCILASGDLGVGRWVAVCLAVDMSVCLSTVPEVVCTTELLLLTTSILLLAATFVLSPYRKSAAG